LNDIGVNNPENTNAITVAVLGIRLFLIYL
jgi:hypothetical protein